MIKADWSAGSATLLGSWRHRASPRGGVVDEGGRQSRLPVWPPCGRLGDYQGGYGGTSRPRRMVRTEDRRNRRSAERRLAYGHVSACQAVTCVYTCIPSPWGTPPPRGGYRNDRSLWTRSPARVSKNRGLMTLCDNTPAYTSSFETHRLQVKSQGSANIF